MSCATTIGSFIKDPDAILDYTIDWSEWLATDTIDTSTWFVPTGITLYDESNTTTTTTVWLSEGVDCKVYDITNRVTTVGGRTDDRTFEIKVRSR